MEQYVTQITTRKGKRHATRRQLAVPWACATGDYKDLSDRALNDLIKDLWHEQRRRTGEDLKQPTPEWDPIASTQFNGVQ